MRDYEQELRDNGIIDPEDINSCLSATGIEISVLSEYDTEHEGYYDSIDEAIDALNKLRKLHPQLSKI